MNEIIGHTIKNLSLEDGGENLVFTTEKGNIIYTTYSECCSRSFFSDIEGLDNLLGEKVLSVTERQEWTDEETKKAESQGDYDSLSLYGYIIKTQKGTCDIEFRNDSNGYYGGSCDLVRDETNESNNN